MTCESEVHRLRRSVAVMFGCCVVMFLTNISMVLLVVMG